MSWPAKAKTPELLTRGREAGVADLRRPVRSDKARRFRRERRRRRILLWAAGLLVLAATSFALYTYVIRDLPLFEIGNLEVRGLDTSTDEGKQIEAAISGAAAEMTTLNLDQELLDEEMSRYPRVASATITASFPDEATVDVVERKNGSVLGEDADALLIATDGTVLGSPGSAVGELPRIGSGDPPEGDRLEGRTLDQAIVLGAVPVELQSYVVESDYGADGVEVTLSNGLLLIFGRSSGATEKWKAAASVIADPELGDVGYVDLTVPRRPAVGTGEGPDEG
jgi:cell division septal protein FtsQ